MSHKKISERTIIEAGRSKGRNGKRNYKNLQEFTNIKGYNLNDLEELPDSNYGSFIPNKLSRHYFNEKGQQLDNISPLRRYLHTFIGQIWNNVYSEIKKTFTGRKDSVDHILSHVKYEIEINPLYINGKIYRRLFGNQYIELKTNELYVNLNGVITKYTNNSKTKHNYILYIGGKLHLYVKHTHYHNQTTLTTGLYRIDQVKETKLEKYIAVDGNSIYNHDYAIRTITLIKNVYTPLFCNI